MWYLEETVPDRPPAPRYWLGGVGKTQGISIGRKHVDIRLKASSVSRTHARLFVEKAPFFMHPHPHRHSTVVAVSDSSAYGTFLKYPKGNPYSRDSNSHHVRLDKDKPSQIFDGALLSFGAPTAWWKLGWTQILIVHQGLAEPQRSRLASIAHETGVDVSDTWIENATHLVTDYCNVANSKFLSALVSSATIIVKLHWIEAINSVVTNAFRSIQEAQNNEAADQATRLPDETQYRPAFDTRSIDTFGIDLLESIQDNEVVERRRIVFTDKWFSFDTENHRSKWENIVKECNGEITSSNKAPPDLDDESSNVEFYFVCDKPQRARVPPGAKLIGESALICAVLSGNVEDLKKQFPAKISVDSNKNPLKQRGQEGKGAVPPLDNSSPNGGSQRRKPRSTSHVDDDENRRVPAMPPTKKMFRGLKGLAKRSGSNFAKEDIESVRHAKRARLLNTVKKGSGSGVVDEAEQSPFRSSVQIPDSADQHENASSPMRNINIEDEMNGQPGNSISEFDRHNPGDDHIEPNAEADPHEVDSNFDVNGRPQTNTGGDHKNEATKMEVERVQLLPARTPAHPSDAVGPDFRTFEPTRVINAPQIRLHPVVDRPSRRPSDDNSDDE